MNTISLSPNLYINLISSYEQVNPVDLLGDVVKMEQNGFKKCYTSDHHMRGWHSGAPGGAAWMGRNTKTKNLSY